MKKEQKNPKEENIMQILKRLVKRVEEATVDIHEMKNDLKFVKLRLGSVEDSTKIMKVDMEKMREDISEIKGETNEIKTDVKKVWREVEDLSHTSEEILIKMVVQKEFKDLSQRVAALENQ